MRHRLYRCLLLIGVIAGLSGLSAVPAQAAVSSWQQSASLVPTSPTDFGTAKTCRSINDLATTGANYVTLVIPIYQSSFTASDIRARVNTPTDASLAAATRCAKARGLRVSYQIHLEAVDNSGRYLGWRAYIKASDRNAWYAAYGSQLNRYATLAKTNGVDMLSLGAELYGMASDRANSGNGARWRTMIAGVRARFAGKLTYSAQRDGGYGELSSIGFWPQLDYIGVSGYFALPGSGGVDALKARWATIERDSIKPVYDRFRKPIVFTEIGYRSLQNARSDPWSYTRDGAPDENEQAMLYEAFLSFWNTKTYVVGVHWWDWSTDDAVRGPGTTSYTPQHKKAQGVLARWFGGRVPAPAVEALRPTNGSTLPAGEQVFRARYGSEALSSYAMTWRVDDDTRENPMYDAYDGGAHKNAAVNLSGWTWRGSGPYRVTFVARRNGAVVGSTTVSFSVGPAGATARSSTPSGSSTAVEGRHQGSQQLRQARPLPGRQQVEQRALTVEQVR